MTTSVDYSKDVCDKCQDVIEVGAEHPCSVVKNSEELRLEFEQPDIADGWEVLAEGDGGGAYGYGSRDLLMYLRGPDGKLYCQEASCCSCNGIEGSFDPVETNIETIEKDLVGYAGEQAGYGDSAKADICREALAKLRPALLPTASQVKP